MPAPARTLAFDILLRVEAGAYASELLTAHTAAFSSRDAGLTGQIVFGVLRYRAQLDYLIDLYINHRIDDNIDDKLGRRRKLDSEVRTALRMAIYQLRYLERIPAHAAVTDSVDLVKRARKRSAAPFVNAVLRKVNRETVAWPNREVELSCPEWLLARWERQFGAAAATGIARAALQEPAVYVHTGTGRTQDIGSQAIVPLLQLAPGLGFLDLCAAPGNKTAQALEAGVHAIACDRHFHRLAQLKSLTPNLVVLDGTRPLPFSRAFDRILVDAPCSGTGTLGRNPEIKWRLSPADLEDLPRRQSALLAHAQAALAPGGLLVYSTCSLEPEENEAVVARAIAEAPTGAPPALILETMRRLPGRDPGDGFYAAVIK